MVKKIGATQFLSMEGDFELAPLNVLIGPNGAGKSNFIEILAILRECPVDVLRPIRIGGFNRWLRHPLQSHEKAFTLTMTLESGVSHEVAIGSNPIGVSQEKVRKGLDEFPLPGLEFDGGKSLLAQYRDPKRLPNIQELLEFYGSIGIYRNWCFGPRSILRQPSLDDMQGDYLEEDGSNLALIVERLCALESTRGRFVELLRGFLEDAEVPIVERHPPRADLYVRMRSGAKIAAERLSDGTLRWMSLLAILLNPNHHRLICIEEPELGLHPDMMGTVADLLRVASEKCQIIVTTHSPGLVAGFSDLPEAIVVCDKREGRTTMRRLKASDQLDDFEDLAMAWASGAIGGNRW